MGKRGDIGIKKKIKCILRKQDGFRSKSCFGKILGNYKNLLNDMFSFWLKYYFLDMLYPNRHLNLHMYTSYYTLNTAQCTTHVYTACCTFITSHCTQSKVTWVGTQDGGGEMNLNSYKQSQMNISFGKQGVILWLHLTQEYNFNIVYKLCNTLLSDFVRSVLSPCLRVRPAAKATP